MENPIKDICIRVLFFFRRHHLFSRMAFFILPIVVIFLYYFYENVFPFADATSIQAGMTLLAEILGVMLGAVLVILVLFFEQYRQSDDLLAQNFLEYRNLIKAHLPLIVKGRKKLIREIPKIIEEFSDSEPRVFKAFMTGFKKNAMALSAISMAFGAEDYQTLLADLEKIENIDKLNPSPKGYQSTESVSIDMDTYSDIFFRVLLDGLNYMELDNWNIGRDVWRFAEKTYNDLQRKGIEAALNRKNYSIGFLNSWLLSSTVIVIAISLFISVFVIFGVTPTSYNYPLVINPIYVAICGFLLSVILLFLSIGKMLGLE